LFLVFTQHELTVPIIVMKAFCTTCGYALRPEAAFCTGCGSMAQCASTPALAPARKSRQWPWILALIVLFVVGYWLGRSRVPTCPRCPAPPTAGTVGGGGGGGGGGGHPGRGAGGNGSPDPGGGGGASGSGRVLGDGGRADGAGGGGSAGGGQGTGDMVGGGLGSANGTTLGHGTDSSATGGGGSDDGGGGGGGKSTLNDAPNDPSIDPDAKRVQAGVARLASGAPLSVSGLDATQPVGKQASVKVLSAPDFRYDKTGLPRYPDANTSVSSAMSYDVEGKTDTYRSSSGILTSSPFDEVVSWYRKSLPAGWSNSTVSDLNRLGALAQALSPDKIMQRAVAPNNAGSVNSVGDIAATSAAERMRLSMFAPPAGTKGDPGVLIVQRGDTPVEIMMKTRVSP
jgi:hypothetical protein